MEIWRMDTENDALRFEQQKGKVMCLFFQLEGHHVGWAILQDKILSARRCRDSKLYMVTWYIPLRVQR